MGSGALESWDEMREFMRNARDARGVTQAAIGEAIGVGQSTIGNWESPNQAATPSPEALIRYLRRLDLSLSIAPRGGVREQAVRELLTIAARLQDDELADLLEIGRAIGAADPVERLVATRVLRGVKAAVGSERKS